MGPKNTIVGIALSSALIATLSLGASTAVAQADTTAGTPSSTTPASTTPASTGATGWTTTFYDDFSKPAHSRLSSRWQYQLGTQYPGGAANWGTGQVETSTDSLSNASMDGNGHLDITALRDSTGAWTSARVETARTDFQAKPGGMMEMTASLRQPNPTSALGYWPAFWALGAAARPVGATNWPSIGELDIMEDVNGLSQVSNTFHCGVWAKPPCNEPEGIGSGLRTLPHAQTGYHRYSVIVDRTNTAAEQLRFLTDGVVKFTVNEAQVGAPTWSQAVDHGFFLILNLAIGGSYPDKVCGCYSAGASATSGASMSVDYVAVYNKAPTTPTPSTAPSPSPAPAPSPTPTPTPSPTPSPTPTPSPAPSPAPSPTPSAAPSAAPAPAPSPTPLPLPASGVSLAWPTSETIMRVGQEVGIWGVTQSPSSTAISIQNSATSLWAHSDGSWGEQQWLTAPTVDPQGTWRAMYTPHTAGQFTVYARSSPTSPPASIPSTSFGVIN